MAKSFKRAGTNRTARNKIVYMPGVNFKSKQMEEKKCILSLFARKWLNVQGYGHYPDKALAEFRYGIRFAYALCGKMVLLGLLRHNLVLLTSAAAIAFFGALFRRHPFDYVYNYLLRFLIRKRPLPQRTVQGRFACGLAAICLSVTVCLTYNNYVAAGYLLGTMVLASATLVSMTDICIPSLIYNSFFVKKGTTVETGEARQYV
jgi:Domain of unknown function (DUF4395)